MASLATAALVTSIAGTALTAVGTIQQGRFAEASADLQAKLTAQRGSEEAAASQRRALAERRKSDLTLSRVRVLAAASGAGASDPTVKDIEQELETQGEYNVLSELYTGKTAERNAGMASEVIRTDGRQARQNAYVQAAGTILSDYGSTLYDRFGRIE